MARKTRKDARETRAAILDAALRIFLEQGVARTSLAEIAREAGVTRGAIYWHFENKADLLNALWDEVRLPFEPLALAGVQEDEPNPLERERELFSCVFEGLREGSRQRQLFQLIHSKCEMVGETEAILQRRISDYINGLARLEKVLTNSVAKGQQPPHFDARLGALFIFTLIDGMITFSLTVPQCIHLDEDVPKLLDGMFRMLQLVPRLENPPD